MYNVTLRRVRETSVAVEKNKHVSVALGIEHAIRMGHIVTWPVRLYSILPRYLIKAQNS